MAEIFNGLVEIRNNSDEITIGFNGEHANIAAGGKGQYGDLMIKNADGDQIFWLNGETKTIHIGSQVTGIYSIVLDGEKGHAEFREEVPGKRGFSLNASLGEFTALDENGNPVLRFICHPQSGALYLGSKDKEGLLRIHDGKGRSVFGIDGNQSAMFIGDKGNAGHIQVRDKGGNLIFIVQGKEAHVYIGANGNDGLLRVLDKSGRNVIQIDGQSGTLFLGVEGNAGVLNVNDEKGRDTLIFVGSSASLQIGTEENGGEFIVKDEKGRNVSIIDSNSANFSIGAKGNGGEIFVINENGLPGIHLDGNNGDIMLAGADCAEEFEVEQSEKIEPGTVLVIDDKGKLIPSSKPYDKRVIGIVSGAKGMNPGIILDKNPLKNNRLPIALNGKVYCKVDAQFSPIEIGDLLTTSPCKGYAMKATDLKKAFGSIIGKALQELSEGKKNIPVLASLR